MAKTVWGKRLYSVFLIVLIVFTPLLSVLMFAVPISEVYASPSISLTYQNNNIYVNFVDDYNRKIQLKFGLNVSSFGRAGGICQIGFDYDNSGVIDSDELAQRCATASEFNQLVTSVDATSYSLYLSQGWDGGNYSTRDRWYNATEDFYIMRNRFTLQKSGNDRIEIQQD